jgi:hypothetical protein
MPRLRATRASATGAADAGAAVAGYDADAVTYFAAVEAADGQTLEAGVKTAINDFIVGCKADSIWSAIKASCILAGARTLAGALVPLVGTAPTNYNFVSGDYNRKTGLKGNATSKRLQANRNNNADPQNSKHVSAYVTELDIGTFTWRSYLGPLPADATGRTNLETQSSNALFNLYANGAQGQQRSSPAVGLFGASRSSASNLNTFMNSSLQSVTAASQTPFNKDIPIYCRDLNGPDQHTNARMSFYSIGEAIDLALLNSRLTTLMSALATAIP